MAANLFQPSLNRVTDGDGNPVSGAKMHFYLTGTTTPATYYTNQAGTVAGTNPLVADADGLFDPAYLDPERIYRIAVKNSDGSETYWDVDGVRGYEVGSSPPDIEEAVADAVQAATDAEAAQAIAETARDVALTAGPYYANQAAGETATTTGQEFAVAPGDGTVIWYRRTGGGSDEIFRPVLATQGVYATAAGETGVINYHYPVGDVRRYGIFPDGTTNWEGSFPTRMNAVYVNSVLFNITWPTGNYATSMNLGVAHSGSKMHFEDCRFYGILHYTGGVSDCVHTGVLRTLDRFGITGEGSSNIRVGTVYCESDPAKNTATPGKAGRGAHIVSCPDFECDLLQVVGCGACDASPTGSIGNLAAIWIESQGLRGVRGRFVVENSQTNGIFINALDINVNLECRSHGGAVIANGAGALQGLTAVQTGLGSGIILHRWTGKARILQSQNFATPLADTYSVLINETGVSSVASTRNEPGIIENIQCEGGDGNRALCFGEVSTPTVSMNVEIGDVSVRLRAGETLAAGYGLFNMRPPNTAADSRIRVTANSVNFVDPAASILFSLIGGTGTRVFSRLTVQSWKAYGVAAGGKLIIADSSAQAGSLSFALRNGDVYYNGGSSVGNKLIDVNSSTDFIISALKVRTLVGASTPFARLINCTDFVLDGLWTDGLRANDHIVIEASTRGTVRDIYSKGGAVTGVGMTLTGAITDVHFERCLMTDFSQGYNSGAAMAFTRCTAVNMVATGNTTNTDMTVAQFPAANQLGCTNWAV